MFQITSTLATHGIDFFPGAPFEGWEVIDARILLEKENVNPPELYRGLIDSAVKHLEVGKKVVIYCSGGASRSNAVALAILVDYYQMEWMDALSLVQDKVPICQIDDTHINALKRMFGLV